MNGTLNYSRSSLLSSLVTQNMTLKVCLISSAAIILVETIAVLSLCFRHPTIIALEKFEPRIITASVDEDEVTAPEIRAFSFDILSRKFSKNPSPENYLKICPYFSEGLKASCQKEVKEKKGFIPQDFIIQELSWDEKVGKANLLIKRFATFNGILSSVNTTLELKIAKRTRSVENPWGLFIEDWKEQVVK